MARKAADSVRARALVLTPLLGVSMNYGVTLAVELPDGSMTSACPAWRYASYRGVVVPGTWIPVTLPGGKPDEAELDEDHVPYDSDVGEVIAEVLGGPRAAAREPDQWRIQLALAYADRIIAVGGIGAAQAEAIKERIKVGV